MWSLRVVFLSPPLDNDSCFDYCVEHLPVQEVMSQIAVERFYVPVLLGTAGLDEERLDAVAHVSLWVSFGSRTHNS